MAFARRVVLALLVVGCQSWKLPLVNQGRRAQFYTQQSDGAYKYGFDSAEGLFQVQKGGPTNEVRGEFGADGGKTEYTAGVGGFVVTSHKKPTASAATRTYTPAHTNAAAVRFATLEELTTPPKPVADTPEVAAAKRQFQVAYDAAAAAAEAAPDTNIITALTKQPSGRYIAPTVNRAQAPRLVQPAVTRVQTFQPVQPAVTYGQSSKPVEVANVRASQSEDGSYQFSYETSDSARHESADSANNVHGNFEFVADDAQRRRVDYKAGAETGFIATGAHLPVSVKDTADVAAAKASFKSAFESAAAAAAAAPDNSAVYVAPTVYGAPAPVSVVAARPTQAYGARYSPRPAAKVRYATLQELTTLPKSVADTPEVAAAKRQFQQAYSVAAAAAEAAPDTGIISGPVAVSQRGFRAGSSRRAPAVKTAYLAPRAPARHFAPVVTLDAAGRVQDTPEVKAAKQAFDQAFRSAAAAAEAAPDTDIITGSAPVVKAAAQAGYSYSAPGLRTTYLAPAVSVVPAGPVVTLDAEGRVEDTAEVKAAKLAFQRTYATAAAAAAAAPDTGIITAPASSVRGSARGKTYYSGAKAAHHGKTQTYSFDGITVMQADGASSPGKFGYTYQ